MRGLSSGRSWFGVPPLSTRSDAMRHLGGCEPGWHPDSTYRQWVVQEWTETNRPASGGRVAWFVSGFQAEPLEELADSAAREPVAAAGPGRQGRPVLRP